jgi:hypothetical protein
VNTTEQHFKELSMNGLLGNFSLETADNFFLSYMEKNKLASEALLAFEHFFLSLNKIFDLYKDLTEDVITGDTTIKWYRYTNMSTSNDYIRATNKYYNEPSFSNVAISVDESEEFKTDNGTCFCKVCL